MKLPPYNDPPEHLLSDSRKHRSATREGCATKKHAGAGAEPSAHEPACTQRKNRRLNAYVPLRVPPVADRPAPHAIAQTAAPRVT